MNQMAILLRRELWENRAITAAPIVIGGLLILIAVLAIMGTATVRVGELPVDALEAARRLDAAQAGSLMQVAFMSIGVTFNSVMIFVIAFYLLDSLYTDRKDRSILFWKSLPVSDTTIVLSKLATAALVIPAVTFLVFLATAVVLWLIGGIGVATSGNWAVLSQGPAAILQVGLTTLYALVVQSLWYMPLFGWLLLASAWAKRGPLWWAVLPPVALILVENLAFGTRVVAHLIGERVTGVFPLAFRQGSDVEIRALEHHGGSGGLEVSVPDSTLALINPGPLLTDPGLWGGFVVAAVFIGAAIWLRRFRDET
jgi:ABC-2 type transport system permease protein